MFNQTKYFKWYDSIISKAIVKNRNKNDAYYEQHHIIPKCMGGTNDASNLVLLTSREHFICHLLLPKAVVHPSHRSNLYCALSYFKQSFSSHMYEKYRKHHAQTMSDRIWINNGVSNKRVHKDSINNFASWNIGRLSYKKTKRMSDEAKAKISKANKGRKIGSSNPAARVVIYNGISYSTVFEAVEMTGLSKYHLKKNGAIFT